MLNRSGTYCGTYYWYCDSFILDQYSGDRPYTCWNCEKEWEILKEMEFIVLMIFDLNVVAFIVQTQVYAHNDGTTHSSSNSCVPNTKSLQLSAASNMG